MNNATKIIHLFVLLLIVCLTQIKNVYGSQHDSTFLVELPHISVRFNNSADITDIEARYTKDKIVKTGSVFRPSKSKSLIQLRAPDSPAIDSLIQQTSCSLRKTENDSTIILQFTSNPILSGVKFTKNYFIDKKRYSLQIAATLFDDNGIIRGEDLQFQYSYDTSYEISRFKIAAKVLKKSNRDTKDTLKIGQWVGSYSKFWTLCIQPGKASQPVSFDNGSILIASPIDSIAHPSLRIYCGPIEYHELQKVDVKLSKLLYPLPFWIRWLSVGFLYLFDILLSIFKSVPVALILLSVCVKIILAPLFKIASAWQKQVNVQNSLLQPRLNEIKLKYKGEEQTKQTLALYKELGISPLYSLKSLLSAAIQIPVFFAAYHMLSEHIALNNVSFLWISDLSSPDHLFKLPFVIPFFGNHFNILPFIMTSITIASSYIHTDTSLSSALQKKQRTNLYWMAALFFFMLYTSPAGMVIYWTMNNLIAFFATIFEVNFYKKSELKTS